jgi:Zn finger protein HypA/HybF involved in hydrogenase expression
MHEMSIALDICRIAEEQVKPEQVPQIITVAVEIGDQAGVEPESLTFWLETLLKEPPFKAARPVLEQVSGDVLRVSYIEVDDEL